MSSPAVRIIKRLQPQDKRSRKIFCRSRTTAIDTRLPLAFETLLREGQPISAVPSREFPSMCDYSLHHVASRPAKVGDKLVTTQFNHSITRGFAAVGEPNVAVCLLPGTEVAFEKEIEFERGFGLFSSWRREKRIGDKVARFRQLNADKPNMHHDALEFPDGGILLVTRLCEGQHARVLQSPAKPRRSRRQRGRGRWGRIDA